MDDDRVRWDARYSARDGGTATVPRAPEALALLGVQQADLMPAGGTALDVACGPGAEVLWLAERGFDVVALDVSPVAIELTRAAAVVHGLTDRVDARVLDLDNGFPDDVSEVAMIVCQRFRGRDLYPQIADRLRRGGLGVVTVLSAVGLDGRPGEFHAPAGELDRAFERDDLDVLASVEADGLASIVIRKR